MVAKSSSLILLPPADDKRLPEGFSLLLRVPLINSVFTHTTFTHLFRRYHEPETKARGTFLGVRMSDNGIPATIHGPIAGGVMKRLVCLFCMAFMAGAHSRCRS